MFPFTAPPADCDVFESVSFEDFWPWMLGQYLRQAHLNTARSMWHAMGDRTSTLTTLAEDTYEFTRLLLRSDLMGAVLRGDETAMRNLVLRDTVELQEVYRWMLPEEVRRHITQTESFRLLSEDESLGLTGVAVSLNSSRLPPAAAGELTLAQLQHAASRSAEILHRESVRPHATGPGSTPYFWGGSPRRPACCHWGNRPRYGTGRGAAGRPPSVRRPGSFQYRGHPHARRSSAPCHPAAPRGQSVSGVRGV
jgi:hypothetical protein